MTFSSRVIAVLASATLFAVLAGCAPSDVAAVQQPLSTSGAELPTAAPSATGPTAPVVWPTSFGPLADGDCAKLLDVAALATALGGSTKSRVTSGDPLLAVVGGIACSYSFGKSATKETGEVSIEVAPSAIADKSERDASLASPTCASYADSVGSHCDVIATDGDWWYSVHLFVTDERAATEQQATFTVVTTQLEAALAAAAGLDHVDTVRPFDCSAIEAGGLLATRSREMPSVYTQRGAIYAAAFLLAGPVTCALPSDEIVVYAGGASAYDQCAHSLSGTSSSIEFPGIKSTVAVADKTSSDARACATDGHSTVTEELNASDGESSFTAADLASFGALLAPVFAAVAPTSQPWMPSLAAPTEPDAIKPIAGGDCEKLISKASLKTIYGASKVNAIGATDPMMATVGGVDCYISLENRSEEFTAYMQIIVAPSAIADPAQRDISLVPARCQADPSYDNEDGTTCSVTVETAGWWYSVTVDTSMEEDQANSSFAALTAAVDKKLTASPGPGRITTKKPFDCDSIKTGGIPVTGSRNMDPAALWPAKEIRAAAFLLAGPESCEFTLPKNPAPWILTIYPGSTSAFGQCRHIDAWYGSKPLTIPGVKSAYSFVGDAGQPEACATDGKSTVVAQWARPDSPAWTTKTRTTLCSLLVPTFAAINAAK
jgi:hypothetical protein